MDNTVEMSAEAAAELDALLGELDDDGVRLLAERIQSGHIDGNTYGDCGCVYSTVYWLQGFSVEQIIEKIDVNREGMFGEAVGFWTPLETFALGVMPGYTPATDTRSAALLAAVERHRAGRAALASQEADGGN